MKFRDARIETKKTIEMVCLILSLGAIFIQIWVLATTLEAYFQGKTEHILASVFLSLAAFAVCALTAWTTGMNSMKGSEEGRTQTYHKHTQF
jgi:ABC-type transport system involved in cytochrome bd biosynthesis fused ATPase/permease subunit